MVWLILKELSPYSNMALWEIPHGKFLSLSQSREAAPSLHRTVPEETPSFIHICLERVLASAPRHGSAVSKTWILGSLYRPSNQNFVDFTRSEHLEITSWMSCSGDFYYLIQSRPAHHWKIDRGLTPDYTFKKNQITLGRQNVFLYQQTHTFEIMVLCRVITSDVI